MKRDYIFIGINRKMQSLKYLLFVLLFGALSLTSVRAYSAQYTLACGGTVSGTITGSDLVSSCMEGYSTRGADYIYFTPPTDGNYHFSFTHSKTSWYFVSDGESYCTGNYLAGNATSTITVNNLVGGVTYTIHIGNNASGETNIYTFTSTDDCGLTCGGTVTGYVQGSTDTDAYCGTLNLADDDCISFVAPETQSYTFIFKDLDGYQQLEFYIYP